MENITLFFFPTRRLNVLFTITQETANVAGPSYSWGTGQSWLRDDFSSVGEKHSSQPSCSSGTCEGSRELLSGRLQACHSPSVKSGGMRGASPVGVGGALAPGTERRLLEPEPQKGKETDKTTKPIHEDPQT